MVNGYAGLSERKFRKWAQMDANTPLCHSERLLCHSEHSEESRPGKGKRFFAHALPPFEGGLGGDVHLNAPKGLARTGYKG